MTRRAERPLVLIDIAVPRDIDPDVAHMPHVRLYDMDNLNAQLEHSLAERMDRVRRFGQLWTKRFWNSKIT